jgi:hypothetical protein
MERGGADDFVGKFVANLKAKATELAAYGAPDSAKTCEQIATDLDADFRAWWLAGLTVGEAARESGYSEERLREMARDGILPHHKTEGTKGHLSIARCDLPRRPKPPESTGVASLEARLLGKRPPLRPAS